MILKNKKGTEGGVLTAVIITILLLVFLGIGLYLMQKSHQQIKDAGDEMFSWLNFANPSCDYDHDGNNNVNDVCPCDDDSDPGSRIYYIQGTQCAVTKRLSVAGKVFEADDLKYLDGTNPTPPAEPSEDAMYVYAIDKLADKKACVKQIEYLANDKGLGSTKICDVNQSSSYSTYYKDTDGAGYSSFNYYQLDYFLDANKNTVDNTITKNAKTNSILLIPSKCAAKMLAWYQDKEDGKNSRFTFTCKTATADCKLKLKDQKC
jgi:hypothetical protein